MDAVAYPNLEVVQFITENLVPVRILANDPVLGPQFRVKWTPLLLILDAEGVEHRRTLGFFPPEDLIPSLLLGMGTAHFNRAGRSQATGYFARIINEFPKHVLAPEAIYLNGVARYIETHDVSNLIGIYEKLSAEYPESPWTVRADPYRFLK